MSGAKFSLHLICPECAALPDPPDFYDGFERIIRGQDERPDLPDGWQVVVRRCWHCGFHAATYERKEA